MLKRFGLFICLSALMMAHSVTARAYDLEQSLVEIVEQTEQSIQIPYASAPIIQSKQTENNSKKVDTVFEMEAIPFETVILEIDDIPVGERLVVSEGIEGELLTIKRITTTDDDISTEVTSEKIVTEPVNEIIHIGTGENILNTNEGYFKYSNKLNMTATAYCLSKECTGKVPGQKGYGITFSGMSARHGVVAVDPNVIPLGTKLYIEGYGHAIAGDTGGRIKGNKIDLFYNDKSIVDKFGLQKRTVYILVD